MTLDAQLEAILFAAAQPYAVTQLAQLLDGDVADVEAGLQELQRRLHDGNSGLQLVRQGQQVELVTRPEAADVVRRALQLEARAELSKPSLETLAILAYRGPITRAEIEQIRGVHSSLILRNLLMRGLIETTEEAKLGQPTYVVSVEFLKHLGVTEVAALPDYSHLRHSATVDQALQEMIKQTAPETVDPQNL